MDLLLSNNNKEIVWLVLCYQILHLLQRLSERQVILQVLDLELLLVLCTKQQFEEMFQLELEILVELVLDELQVLDASFKSVFCIFFM
jgi:hypothetical protein